MEENTGCNSIEFYALGVIRSLSRLCSYQIWNKLHNKNVTLEIKVLSKTSFITTFCADFHVIIWPYPLIDQIGYIEYLPTLLFQYFAILSITHCYDQEKPK